LLEWSAVPVINENDTVATSEIRYGDNDRLAAPVATMVSADALWRVHVAVMPHKDSIRCQPVIRRIFAAETPVDLRELSEAACWWVSFASVRCVC